MSCTDSFQPFTDPVVSNKNFDNIEYIATKLSIGGVLIDTVVYIVYKMTGYLHITISALLSYNHHKRHDCELYETKKKKQKKKKQQKSS